MNTYSKKQSCGYRFCLRPPSSSGVRQSAYSSILSHIRSCVSSAALTDSSKRIDFKLAVQVYKRLPERGIITLKLGIYYFGGSFCNVTLLIIRIPQGASVYYGAFYKCDYYCYYYYYMRMKVNDGLFQTVCQK